MILEVKFTNSFKNDLKLVKRQNKNLNKLLIVIEKIANYHKLEEMYHDHPLLGEYSGTRECHIEPDWLLIYEIIEEKNVLILYRTGSHSKLFR